MVEPRRAPRLECRTGLALAKRTPSRKFGTRRSIAEREERAVSQQMPPFREGTPREWLEHEQRSRDICDHCGRRVRPKTVHEHTAPGRCKTVPKVPPGDVKPGT